MVLKEKHLDQRVRRALSLTPILLDKKEIIVTELAQIIYELSETGVDREESIEESLSATLENIEKSIEESTESIISSDVIEEVREAVAENNILQRIITAKVTDQ